MQFNAISALVGLVGLVAFTSAAPYTQAEIARDLGDHVPRGLTFIPKRKNKNDAINVIDTTFEQITEVQQGSEVELTTLVQKKLTEESGIRNSKDQIRKNHFAAKNQNVNTVLTVVTEIVDARANEQVTRLMTHQLNIDNGAQQNLQVQVTELKKITITANEATKASQNAAAQASAGVQIQQIAQNAPFLASNATIMLPPGASPPASSQVELDPAAILEEGQSTLFVTTA